MIRPLTADDIAGLLALVDATGLFSPDEHAELAQLLIDYRAAASDAPDCWVVDDTNHAGLAGVAYYAPERMTEGTWNLYLLVVHPRSSGTRTWYRPGALR